MEEKSSGVGWHSKLPEFVDAKATRIETALREFVGDASAQQERSWHNSVRWLKREYRRLLGVHEEAATYTTLLEYELPRDFRRPDVIVLEGSVVVVVEIKGRNGNTSHWLFP